MMDHLILSNLSDTIASLGYGMLFILSATWFGIAVSHMMTGMHVWRWGALAAMMACIAVSFFLMAAYTGWRTFPYSSTLAVTRITFTLAALPGLVFTVFYLASMWTRSRHADDQNVD